MININVELVQALIAQEFPEYTYLLITSVESQGNDNRTFRLGDEMLVKLTSGEEYVRQIAKEQELLPKLKSYLSFDIPAPIKMGASSADYPYPFSIYMWLEGKSINLINKEAIDLEMLAQTLAKFLKELQAIKDVDGVLALVSIIGGAAIM